MRHGQGIGFRVLTVHAGAARASRKCAAITLLGNRRQRTCSTGILQNQISFSNGDRRSQPLAHTPCLQVRPQQASLLAMRREHSFQCTSEAHACYVRMGRTGSLQMRSSYTAPKSTTAKWQHGHPAHSPKVRFTNSKKQNPFRSIYLVYRRDQTTHREMR